MNRMSHDVRTPINGIMGMLDIIRKNRQDEAKVDDCLDKSIFPQAICWHSSTMCSI